MNRKTALEILLLSFIMVHAALAQTAPKARVEPIDESGELGAGTKPVLIHIRFDQDMDGGMSVTRNELEFPKLVKPARWSDPRTLVLTLELEPDRSYGFGINGGGKSNFRSKEGLVAETRDIRFRSAGGRALTRAEKSATIARLREALARDYSYRELHGLSSDFAINSEALLAAGTPGAFAEILAADLARIPDPHLSLRVGNRVIPCYRREQPANASAAVVARKLGSWNMHTRNCASAEIEGGIRYVLLATLADRESVAQAIKALKAEPAPRAFIIDLRLNGGGDEGLAREVAGLFTDQRRLYARQRIVDRDAQSGFREEGERWLQPAQAGSKIEAPLAVLMGPGCLSSTEALLLMFRAIPGTKLIGQASGGSSGRPRPIDLGCDLVLNLPSWIALDAEGQAFEGRGIAADIRVRTTPEDLEKGRDPILDAAIADLRATLAR